MQAPHVAVVGGGIAGCLSALVLRSRGVHATIFDKGTRSLGGRLGSSKHGVGDRGAQFICASEGSRLMEVLTLLERNDLVAQWTGRFGLLGSHGGGFLPREIISSSLLSMRRAGDEGKEEPSNAACDAGDFCSFIGGGGSSSESLYVAVPSMAELCDRLCHMGNFDVRRPAEILGLDFCQNDAKWRLIFSEDQAASNNAGNITTFDAIILASGQQGQGLAVSTVRGLLETSSEWDANTLIRETGAEKPVLVSRLSQLADNLEDVAGPTGALPLVVLSVAFPKGSVSEELPFDAVTCPSSHHIQFIVREASKPGRDGQGEELFTAVSTASYAKALLESSPGMTRSKAEGVACGLLMNQLSLLIAPYFRAAPPSPSRVSARFWKRALPARSLGLNEDCVSLEPWRLAISGDFLGSRQGTPLEAAALSGLAAGERVASWFSPT